MFQYTSETIINSSTGALIDATGAKKRWLVKDGMLIIDGVTAVKLSDICKIYHTPYLKEELAKAEIIIPSQDGDGNTLNDKVIRLRINLTEQGNSRSILQNAYLHKAKPFTYEIIASGNSAADADKLENVIKTELAETDFKLFTVTNDKNGKLTFEATDEYIRFADARGMVLSAGIAVGGVELFKIDETIPTRVGTESAVSLVKGNISKLGCQGAGTVKRLVKDLRIPTSAKVDPFELKDGGMPVPGGMYDQYLIEVVTDRRHIAGGVVGSINQSLTSFVLFIKDGDALTDWTTSILSSANLAKMANGAGVTVEEAGIPASNGVASGAARQTLDGDTALDYLGLKIKTPNGVGNIG